MAISSLEHQKMLRRRLRSRTKLAQNQQTPRISVNRSLRHISAQLIDDAKGITLTSSSDHALTTGTKTEAARTVGTLLAEQAKALGITSVRFDRGANRYHGRVAALAEAAREAGLTF